jgi:hypothetical protein
VQREQPILSIVGTRARRICPSYHSSCSALSYTSLEGLAYPSLLLSASRYPTGTRFIVPLSMGSVGTMYLVIPLAQ